MHDTNPEIWVDNSSPHGNLPCF